MSICSQHPIQIRLQTIYLDQEWDTRIQNPDNLVCDCALNHNQTFRKSFVWVDGPDASLNLLQRFLS